MKKVDTERMIDLCTRSLFKKNTFPRAQSSSETICQLETIGHLRERQTERFRLRAATEIKKQRTIGAT